MKKIALTVAMTAQSFESPAAYTRVITKNGYWPLLLATAPEPISLSQTDFDGLILTSGTDITPIFYNEEPLPFLGETMPQRDRFEIALVKAARKAGIPILGIGRGMQLINVALGGTLYQDLYAQNSGAGIQHKQKSALTQPSHHVEVSADSRLITSIGSHPYVNSFHHQGIKDLAPGLKAAAFAPDGICEAIESQDGQLSGVQWHPETLWETRSEQDQLFTDFFAKL